jgi:hypothetical protein
MATIIINNFWIIFAVIENKLNDLPAIILNKKSQANIGKLHIPF